MAKVQIIINDLEVSDFDPDKLGLSTSWQSKLIDQLNAFKTKATKTITLPLTKSLQAALDNPSVIDSQSLLNPDSKPTIKISVDGEPFIDGYIKLTTIVVNESIDDAEFVVVPIERDWIAAAKALNMQDIDLSTYDHTHTDSNLYLRMAAISLPSNYTYAPVDTGWVGYRKIISIVDAGGGSARIYYIGEQITTPETVTIVGCEDTSHNVEATLTDSVSGFWNGINVWWATTPDVPVNENSFKQTGYFIYNSSEVWQMHDFVPFIQLNVIFQSIFTEIGWTLEADDYLAVIDGYWHYQYNETNLKKALNKRLEFKTGIVSGHYTLTGVTGTIIAPFTDLGTLGLKSNQYYDDTDSDTLANVVAGTNVSEWVAPESCWMHLEARCYFFGNASTISLVVYDTVGSVYHTVDTNSLTSTTKIYDETVAGLAYIPVGYSVRVNIEFTGSSFTPVLFDDSYFHGFPVVGLYENSTVHLQDFLPDVTAYEWLKEMALIHQLRFYSNDEMKIVGVVMDKDNMNGNVNSWVDKLDRKSPVELTPIGSLHPASYRLDYLSDDNDYDLLSKEAISGRFAGANLNNNYAFAEGTTQISLSIYAATINGLERYDVFDELGFPTMRGEGGIRERDYAARIFEIEQLHQLNLYFEDTGVFQYFYFTTHFTTAYARATFPTVFHFDSLLTNYWNRFEEIINYGHLLQGAFDIKVDDILKLTTNDVLNNDFRAWHPVMVKNQEVRCELYRIIDYQPTQKGTTKVELLWIIKS